MLDGLVGADRTTEGQPLLGVLDADLERPARRAETLGRQDHAADPLGVLPARPGVGRHDLQVGRVELDDAEPAGRVDRLPDRGAAAREHHVVAAQCQEPVGPGRVEDGTPLVHDSDGEGAVDECGEPLRVVGEQHRRPGERHQGRSGKHPAGLLCHDREVEDRAASATGVLGHGDGREAALHQRGAPGAHGCAVVQRSPQVGRGGGVGEEVACGGREVALLVVQVEVHRCSSLTPGRTRGSP